MLRARSLLLRPAFGLALAIALPVAAHSETAERPGRWIGQVDESRRLFDWPGSGAGFAIEGSRLSVRLGNQGENSLEIVVDGVSRRLDLRTGEQDYEIFDGTQGRHQIKLLKRTEGDVGAVRLVSAETDGRFVPPQAPRRRILVIGDSISTGYGIEGRGPECLATPQTQNQMLTYAGQTAAALDAEATVLAASGRGLVRNYNGATEGTMRDLADRAVQSQAEPSHPAKGPFDLVLVHLGTNDFVKDGTPPGFGEAYEAGLRTLRQRYPDASIYALIGPMLAPDRFDAASRAIRSAVETRQRAGDRQVRFFPFAPPPTSFGCAWHPGVEGQRDMAERLIERVKADQGW
ncbi:hypothetical protein NS365_08335 [Aureimonas ureilytica]|uniref:SGNH hydrolase-type esterase domain-containing protein n=1 Tax=Aureimonas ureilytica TaxID=401562 RepID=A0A175RQP8_9HYPH|nr:SGNH/GDSL hydrolase family protein [Aureimonas ureilytica]KTR06135.1 hypothetical protein NS365_08335 [Aureimonas ureilytica]